MGNRFRMTQNGTVWTVKICLRMISRRHEIYRNVILLKVRLNKKETP